MENSRPYGFRDFVRARGYCSLYLLSSGEARPVKVGITNDPVRRLDDFQTAHYRTSRVPPGLVDGRPADSSQLESAFKLYFFPDHIRGEWYDIDLAEAVAFVEETIVSMGTWGVTQERDRNEDDARRGGQVRHAGRSAEGCRRGEGARAAHASGPVPAVLGMRRGGDGRPSEIGLQMHLPTNRMKQNTSVAR